MICPICLCRFHSWSPSTWFMALLSEVSMFVSNMLIFSVLLSS